MINPQTKEYLTQEVEATVQKREATGEQNVTYTARYHEVATPYVPEPNEPFFRNSEKVEPDEENVINVAAGEIVVTKAYFDVDAVDSNKSSITSQDKLIMSPQKFEHNYVVMG